MLAVIAAITFMPLMRPKAASNVTKKSLYAGSAYTLKINGKTTSGKWTSSNTKVATVSSKGKITAKAKGKATITAKIGKKKYQCAVTVLQPVTKVTMASSLNISGNGIYLIDAKASPSSANKRNITWESSNTKVVEIIGNMDFKDVSTVIIKGVSNGTCEIRATASDRHKVYASCKVKVTGIKKKPAFKSKYSYQIYLIDGLGKDEWYKDEERLLYIKTDNPDKKSLSMENDGGFYGLVSDPSRFDNIDYREKYDINSFFIKVDGGYLTEYGVSTANNKALIKGNTPVNLMLCENGHKVASFKCTMKNMNDAENQVLSDIIKKTTTKDMTPFEKMDAVCDYFENSNAKYLTNSGKKLLDLADMPNSPWFRTWRFDSLTTPNILCKAAKLIGGFDKIENGYEKYYGTDEWQFNHCFAEVTIGNKTRAYTFCPMSETGYVDKVQKVNFNNTSKFIRVY